MLYVCMCVCVYICIYIYTYIHIYIHIHTHTILIVHVLVIIENNNRCTIQNVKWSRYRPGVAQRVGRGIALLFHDRDTRRGWVVSRTPRPHFTPGKDLVPIVQEAGWAPGPVWTGGKSRPHRDSIPDHPTRSQSLYRLSYRAHTYIKLKKNHTLVYLLLFNDVRTLDYTVSNVRIYCHLWSAAWLYHIFPNYLINGTILSKMLLNIKGLFWCSLQSQSDIFSHSVKNWARKYQKCKSVFM